MNDQAERLRFLARTLQDQVRSQVFEAVQSCRVIAVTSGKGGVGKTNLALGLALALAKAKYRVLLWDADLGLANVDIILGIVPKYNLTHVLKGERSIREVLIEGPAGLRVIPGGSGIEEIANVEPLVLTKILREMAALDSKLDYLFIDTGAGITRQVLAVALAATEVMLVTTPEPTALTDAYGMIKVLKNHRGAHRIKLIVNMAKNEREGEAAAEKLVRVARQFLGVELKVVGYVPYDRAVPDAVKKNQHYYLASPHAPASLSTLKIASSLGKIKKDGNSGLKDFVEQVVSFLQKKPREG